MDLLTPTLPLLHALHLKALQLLAVGFSALGSEGFYLLLLPLVYWFYDRRIGAQLGMLLLFSVFVNDIAKFALHLPRPYWIDPSLTPHLKAALEPTFGFPSGHSQGAFLIWPFLALRSKNPRKWLPLALGLATCIALSRIVLGVHWPIDVLGGAFIGGAVLLGFERFGTAVERAFRKQSVWTQLALVVLLVGVLWLVGTLFYGRASFDLGANTHGLEGGARSLMGRASALFGLLIGLMFAPRDIPIRRSPLYALVGFAGVALFYFGLSKASHAFLALEFARYFLTTFWVACGSLWVFRRLGLEGRRPLLLK